METSGEITQLIGRWRSGDRGAERRLFELMYADLRTRAAAVLYHEGRTDSLGATGLVHEAYIRFEKLGHVSLQDRHHFLCFAAHVMRQVLVDRARSRFAQKRGRGAEVIPYDDEMRSSEWPGTVEILHVNQALQMPNVLSDIQIQIVEMRFFAGYTNEEIGMLLGISSRHVKRLFGAARARLKLALEDSVNARSAEA